MHNLPIHHNVNNGTAQPPPLPEAGSIPGTEPGDPGPLAPESIAQQRIEDPIAIQLRELGDLAKRGVNYQFAVLALLAGYASMWRHMTQALSYLTPEDLEPSKGLRDELKEVLAGAERALHAQQPPVREAAE